MSDRNKQPDNTGLPAGEWFNIFRGEKVEVERLDAAKSAQGKSTIIGNFLARMVDREFTIEVDGRTGKAKLRTAAGRGNKKLYWFDVSFDGDEPGDDTQSPGDKGAPRKHARKVPKKLEVESRDSPIDRRPPMGLSAVERRIGAPEGAHAVDVDAQIGPLQHADAIHGHAARREPGVPRGLRRESRRGTGRRSPRGGCGSPHPAIRPARTETIARSAPRAARSPTTVASARIHGNRDLQPGAETRAGPRDGSARHLGPHRRRFACRGRRGRFPVHRR